MADFREHGHRAAKSYPQGCVENLWATPVQPGEDFGTTADELWMDQPRTALDRLSGWASFLAPCGYKKTCPSLRISSPPGKRPPTRTTGGSRDASTPTSDDTNSDDARHR